MKLKLATVVLLACAACHERETKSPQRVNIEVIGSPECLGSTIGRLGFPAATMPVWSAHIGTMELGPFDTLEFPRVVKQLRTMKCVRAIRQRPCATPMTDVETCSAPDAHS